eukprot:15276644-Alexandrium_andersonii.AAC.1
MSTSNASAESGAGLMRSESSPPPRCSSAGWPSSSGAGGERNGGAQPPSGPGRPASARRPARSTPSCSCSAVGTTAR